MKPGKHTLKPLIILVVAGLAGYWAYTALTAEETASLSFTGSVEADQIDLSPEISGKVISIPVQDGATVKAGETLVILDTTDYDLKLQMAQTALRVASLNASDVSDGATGAQVRQAEANMESVREQLEGSGKELEYLKRDLADTQALFDSGAASEQQLDTARRAVDREQAKYQALVKQKDALSAALAQIREGATAQVRDAAQEQVRLKELEIQDLERTISKGVMTSPLDGAVQSVNYEVGERVSPGQRIVTLMDLSQMELKIYVPEKLLNRVHTGMPVAFTDAFLKDKGVKGTITYISSKAEFTPKNIESKENKQEMVYEVRIELEDPSGTVKPGMFLDVLLKEGNA